MNKLKIYTGLFLLLINKISFAATDGGIFGNSSVGTKLKNGDEITLSMIPKMIKYAINFFIGIAGTISIIFIIIGAYQILFGSLQQDKTKGKNTIIMALGGFVIATLAWFIVEFVFDNFG